MSRDCCKQAFCMNEHEGVWELLRLKGTLKNQHNDSTLSPHDAETGTNISLKARGFPMCPWQNLGLWTSEENLSFLGFKQENYTKPASVWGHRENPKPCSAGHKCLYQQPQEWINAQPFKEKILWTLLYTYTNILINGNWNVIHILSTVIIN